MRFKKNDQQLLAEAYNEVHQGGYGSTDSGSATSEDVTRMNQFLHNVLSNYAYSREIPKEYQTALQSWSSAVVTADNYDKVSSLIQNISQRLPNTDISDMINKFIAGKSSRGTTTPFAQAQSNTQSS